MQDGFLWKQFFEGIELDTNLRIPIVVTEADYDAVLFGRSYWFQHILRVKDEAPPAEIFALFGPAHNGRSDFIPKLTKLI
jgi:hypothetical protein